MWNHTIGKFMIKMSFNQCESDLCVYIKRTDRDMDIVVLYVEDLIIASSDNSLLVSTKRALIDHFEMTNLGELKYFLRIKIRQDQVSGRSTMQPANFSSQFWISVTCKTSSRQDASRCKNQDDKENV